MIHQCSVCNFKSIHKWVVTRHVKKKHKAPTNTHLQPEVVHSSTEIPQQVPGYQVPMKGYTAQQFDPRSIPQIQYNELNHQGYGPQTVKYSVNPVTNEDTDTETVSEADTEDQEEYNIYEILNDIHLAFDHLKDLREQYGKALPQLKQLDEEEMDKFLYKYAELKIDIIDEQDGLEGTKVQRGSGLNDIYEGDTDEEAVDDDGDTDEEAVDDDGEGDTDEEAVDDEEAMDEEEEGKDVVDGEKVMCKGCLKERFFDFIFEAEEFMTPDSHKKRLHYEKIFREAIKEAIEKDESNKAENVDEMIEDVEHLRNEFDEDGNICFKYCSKRKINTISDMVDALLDNELGDDLKKSNPRKFKYIKELLKPYRNSIRKLRDPAVDIHEKRKVLQKPMVGEGVLDSLESVVTPMLKKKRC